MDNKVKTMFELAFEDYEKLLDNIGALELNEVCETFKEASVEVVNSKIKHDMNSNVLKDFSEKERNVLEHAFSIQYFDLLNKVMCLFSAKINSKYSTDDDIKEDAIEFLNNYSDRFIEENTNNEDDFENGKKA